MNQIREEIEGLKHEISNISYDKLDCSEYYEREKYRIQTIKEIFKRLNELEKLIKDNKS